MIQFIVLAIIGAILFLIMRAMLVRGERLLATIIIGHPDSDHLGASIPNMPGYSPPGAPTNTTVVATTVRTTSVVSMESFRHALCDTLAAAWPELPEETFMSATAVPEETLLSTEPTAEAWGPLVLTAVVNEMAAATGLPAHVVAGLVKAGDLHDIRSLATAEHVAITAAAAWQDCKNHMDSYSFMYAVKLLSTRNRPLALVRRYYQAAKETNSNGIFRLLATAEYDNTTWMPLRTRAGD